MQQKNLPSFQEPWIKRWAGSYTFISCSYWGKQYYSSLHNILGIWFNQTVFIHRKGTVSFFVRKSEFETVGKTLADRTIQHKEQAIERLAELKKNTDIILEIMDRYEGKILTTSEYNTFITIFDRHLAYHNFMKKTVDFLPPETLQELMPYFKDARVYSEAVYSRTESFFRTFAQAIAQKEWRNADILTCLSQEDIENYLQKGILPADTILQDRYEASALVFDAGKEQIYCGDTVDDIEDAIARSVHSDTITWFPAFPGKAQGICRVVLDPFNPGEFNQWDILVTGMTRPEFLPLFQKAAAVVTDAGWILCHAAITARELKKPTIVGTEIATKILENGDMIEVDAEKGTVKKL